MHLLHYNEHLHLFFRFARKLRGHRRSSGMYTASYTRALHKVSGLFTRAQFGCDCRLCDGPSAAFFEARQEQQFCVAVPPPVPATAPEAVPSQPRGTAAQSPAASELARRREPDITDLDDGLWLGPGRAAADSELLRTCQITHILNVADDVPNYHEADEALTYCRLDVGDFGSDAGVRRVFEQAHVFVAAALASDSADGRHGRRGVLIHCANGSNRSPTVAIAVLMQLRRWSLANAWSHVSSRRPVQPLADMRRELLAYERERGSSSMVEGAHGALVYVGGTAPREEANET